MLLKYSQIVNNNNLCSSCDYFSIYCTNLVRLPAMHPPGGACLVSAFQQEKIESGTDFSFLLSLSQGCSSINTLQRVNIPEKKFRGIGAVTTSPRTALLSLVTY